MTYPVVFDIAAEGDLTELYDYLLPRAGESDAAAYVNDIIDYCVFLSTFPERGTRSERSPGLRTVGFRRKATMAFRVKGDVITVMRIFYGGRTVVFPQD